MTFDLAKLFPESSRIDGSAPEEARADWLSIPGKGAVYLLVGEEAGAEKAMLLATVGDLRAALRRRLADTPAELKSKRVEYGKICTRVYWRRVDSGFAADWWYWHAAKALFPGAYRGMIGWRNSWWVGVERAGVTPFPRFRKTSQISDGRLAYAGPVRDKHAAQRLVESLEDLFDLCRYHEILVQAPRGKACAYKEMGKCPAPCDGTVPLEQYRGQVDAALAFAGNENRGAWRRDLENAMRDAAAKLEFEKAGRLKQRLTRAGVLENEALAFLGPLEDFAFLALLPGKGKTAFEAWIFSGAGGGRAACVGQFAYKELEAAAEVLARRCAALMQGQQTVRAFDERGTEEAAIVAHHLFKGEREDGVWLQLHEARDAGAIVRAAEELRNRKKPAPMAEQASDGTKAGNEPSFAYEENNVPPADK